MYLSIISHQWLTENKCDSSFFYILFATSRTVAHKAPPSMEFSRQEYWSGLPFLFPGDLPDPGAKPALAGRFFTTELPGKPCVNIIIDFIKRPAAATKSLQLCLTLCDPIDGSPPGSPSLGFSRHEHWSALPFPSPVHESEK